MASVRQGSHNNESKAIVLDRAGGFVAACASRPNGAVAGLAWARAGAAHTAGQTVNVEAYSGSESLRA